MATALSNRLHHWRMRVASSPFGEFLRWWGGELAAMLPASWRARLAQSRRRLLLSLGDGELHVEVHDGETLQSLDTFPLDRDPRVQGTALRDLLAGHELAEAPRDLVLDGGLVLRKDVTMPLATEPNLRQALTYEMDRQTPFRADDVFFDYRVTGRDREAGTLRVELCVAPRKVVSDRLEPIVSRGLPPTGVDVLEGDMPAGFNLLPAEQRARVVNRQTRINWYLAGAAVLVLAVVMAESLYLRQAQLEQLDTRIEDLRAEAMQVQRIDNQIEEASASATFLLDQRAAMAPSVVVLTEVTSILPDDTYLDRLLIGDGRVQMQGKSENAQRLIELINESERFEAASFRGPTRLDSRTQREIFDLNADIAAAGGE